MLLLIRKNSFYITMSCLYVEASSILILKNDHAFDILWLKNFPFSVVHCSAYCFSNQKLILVFYRLENLDLMSKHGPDAWKLYNQRLEAFLARLFFFY